MSPFAENIALTFAPHLKAAQTQGLFCALSGGADSVALLLVLQELRVPVTALHCNFHLRGEESHRDEAFVRRLCQERDVPLEVEHFDTLVEARRTGESVEMAARRLRYTWFAQHARPTAVAHHADDNIETLLLNLIRGTGIRGLTGMRFDNGANILRPLLAVNRSDILHYLAQEEQSFVDDSTNADTTFRRNFVRHRLLPLLQELNPSVRKGLLQTQQHLQAAEAVYTLGLQQLTSLFSPRTEGGTTHYPLLPLREQGEVGRLWLYEQLAPLGFSAEAVDALLTAREGATAYSRTHLAAVSRGSLEVAAFSTLYAAPQLPFSVDLAPLPVLQKKRVPRPTPFQPSRAPHIATIDAHTVVGELTLRQVLSADRFTPYGMRSGSKLVSDYLTDRHRSRIDKLRALVVCDEVGILWLVGETIAHRAAVTPATGEILTLTLTPA